MPDSLSSWLALREAADTAARSASLTRAMAGVLSHENSVQILDLGSGTGSNVRYLSPRLPGPQHWLLLDRDADLLAEAPAGTANCQIETLSRNLGSLDDPHVFTGRHLVTASALLDLVSETWLRSLAARCRECGAALLFALTYNGGSRCWPEEPEDEAIRDLMNRHQKANDRGFGRAAGPDAVDVAVRRFVEVGYDVRRDVSDWVLSPEAQALQRRLIEGWAEAALEVAPEHAAMIRDWLTRRLAHVDLRHSRVVVGHEDLAAWLPSTK